jgi:hypothetical protein
MRNNTRSQVMAELVERTDHGLTLLTALIAVLLLST